MLILYATPLSANGRKALAVSQHLELTPQVVLINVYRGEGRAAEYLAVNPQGKVPSLVDGNLMLWESNAILQYLAEAHGDYRLWSRDPRRRADLSRWLFWEAAHWQPTLGDVLRPVVAQKLGLTPGAPPAHADYENPTFRSLAQLLDGQLASGRFIGGDELTLPDFAIAAMMTYARVAAFPFDVYTNIARWFARIEALPAWQSTAAPPWT
jgi:glutathione S-transferase